MESLDFQDVVAYFIIVVASFALNRAGNAPPPPPPHPPPPPPQLNPASFIGLPADIQIEILELLDLNTVCRVYAACSGHPSFEVFRRGTASHFRRFSVEVTPEHVVKGDNTKIDFEMLSLLPPCHIHVKTTMALWELTKTWISVLEFRSLKLSAFGYQRCDLKGLQGNPVAMNFKNILNLDTANIPKSVKELRITGGFLKGNILDIGALAASLTTLSVDSTDAYAFPCASLLSNLQHYTGKYVADLPWSQLKTVVVDRIPDGTRCDSLEEVTFTRPFNSTLENRNYPRLTSASFVPEQTGIITELFTPDQLIRLKKFKGENVLLNDLTSLPNVEVLHVKYEQTLFRHTALPPHLVELKIVSNMPVEGIPDQLTVFGYVNRPRNIYPDITVDSSTLKRLSVQGAIELTVECPHLEELALEDVQHSVVVGTPTVRKMSLKRSNIPQTCLPTLRQLHIMGRVNNLSDVVIDKAHHLESVTLEYALLDRVSISADKVSLEGCRFAQTPSIDAIALDSWDSLRSGDGVSCQELVCDAIERIPRMVEKLDITGRDPIAADSLIGCDNLKALSISISPAQAQDELNIPESVEKLCLQNSDESMVDVRPEQLKWYQGDRTCHQYIASRMLADSAVQVGPYLVCKPEVLPSE